MPGFNGKGPAGNKPGRRMGCCANSTAETETNDNLNRKGRSGGGRGMRNGGGRGFWRSEQDKPAGKTE